MPRLNIEESFWSDPKTLDLIAEIGQVAAVGAWVLANKVAQSHWAKDRSLIPKDKAKKLKHFDELLSSEWLMECDEGYYFSGSKTHHEWLLLRKKAASRGGKGRYSNINNLEPSKPQANASKSKQTQASNSNSNSNSNSVNKNNCETGSKKKKAKPKKQAIETAPTWQKYFAAYRKRYGVDPVRNAKTNSQMKSFVTRIGENESPHVAEFFVGCGDSWFCKQGHSLDTLLKNAENLRMRWATGKKSEPSGQQTGFALQRNRNLTDAEILGDEWGLDFSESEQRGVSDAKAK
jgi:hypothetical protein